MKWEEIMNIAEKELERKIKERRVRKQLHMLHRKDKIILVVLVVVSFALSLMAEPKNVPWVWLMGHLLGFH